MKLEKFKEKDTKKKGIVIFTICCVLLIAGVFFSSSFALFETNEVFNLVSGNVKEMQDISFTYYVDHQIVKKAPEKGSGKLFDEGSSTCTNDASVRWNYESWSPVVTNWNQTKTKCSISFSTAYSEDILNGSFPSLKTGLIPITIKNDGLVKKADTTSKWYSYAEKNWANAVITRSSFDGLQYNGKVSGATKQDGYVSFDGVDDYVDLGLENYDFGSSATIAVKFRLTKTSTDWQNLLDNIAKAGFCLSVSTDQLLTFSIYSSDVSGYVTVQSEPIDLQKEYVAVGVYENQQMKLYLNGVLIGEKSLSNAATVSGMPFVLGANPDASGYSQYASTDIFQATILDRALTEEEIKENYASDIKVKNEEGLLKYVNFAKDMYEANEVIPEESIESYFVWIPRYRYKIFNEGNYNGLTANVIDNKVESKTQAIEIAFENKDVLPSTGVSVGEWRTHPAFTSFHSNGMWIGKFETSKSNTNPDNSVNPEGVQIKPNVSSWRYVQVANAFYSAYDYKRNLDSHMMKNTEWGAVAYFSHTIYGVMKNIRFNNTIDYYTGYAANFEPTCGHTTSNIECNKNCNHGECNEPYNTETGYLASTTGNITGIYDMSGGAWEYVMGMMMDQSGNFISGSNNDYHSGFVGVFSDPSSGSNPSKTTWTKEDGGLAVPEAKYYDLYPYFATGGEYLSGYLGDATKELGPFGNVIYNSVSGTSTGSGKNVTSSASSWYTNHFRLPIPSLPGFMRGGQRHDGSEAGIFASYYGNMSWVEDRSFRVVLDL